jgi:uncharacterized membrane protein
MRKDLDAELPSHVEQTVQTIAALHGQHQRRTSRAQQFVQATTRIVGSPIFAGIFTVLLTLWLAINAKIIELLERLRRDHPNIADRVDEDATAMSQPTNAEAVIEAINSSQEPGEVTSSV